MHQPAPSGRRKRRVRLLHLADIAPGKRLLQSRCPSGITPQLQTGLHQRLQRRSPAPGNMTVSLAACLLAALLGTGAGLQCEVCSALGQNCSGSLQPCPAGQDSCGIFLSEVTLGRWAGAYCPGDKPAGAPWGWAKASPYELWLGTAAGKLSLESGVWHKTLAKETPAGGIKSQGILKGCVLPSQCTAGPISVNFGMEMTRTGVACCTGVACGTVNVTLPPPDTEPNGRRCPACFSVVTGQCSEKIVSCTGSETQCLEAVGTVNTGNVCLLCRGYLSCVVLVTKGQKLGAGGREDTSCSSRHLGSVPGLPSAPLPGPQVLLHPLLVYSFICKLFAGGAGLVLELLLCQALDRALTQIGVPSCDEGPLMRYDPFPKQQSSKRGKTRIFLPILKMGKLRQGAVM
ncbi:uncharacterized protein LOC142819681 [Pelodiscus sinensis]|uniref:uncharacterized protein LOC142819681 n=1 Tax=Pelodiscus sinensis TaxID=13735 RepID=UPI003F6D4E41